MSADDLHTICQALPIFPLPRVVLLPREVLPLHVFEPRYRALLHEVMESHGMMGMATLKPGYELAGETHPEIYPELGVGKIVRHQSLPDGRSNILLESVCQARVVRELPTHHPFRLVAAAVQDPASDGLDAAVSRLQSMVLQVGALSPEATAEAQRLIALDGVEMAHSLARKLLDDSDERRAYVGMARTAQQVDLVCDRLARFLTLGVGPVAEA